MITPTVGRVVWYYPSGSSNQEQPLAALVAHVWSDIRVNLAVFDVNGSPSMLGRQSVLLLQDDEEAPAGRDYCCWMPYQVSQAKKHETTP